MTGKVVHEYVEAVKCVGRSHSEETEICPASLDNRPNTSSSVRLACTEEDIHLALADAHVVGESAGVKAGISETVSALMPVLDSVERRDLALVELGIVVSEGHASANLADEEEQDSFRRLKRDPTDGALVIPRRVLLFLLR